MLLVLSAWATHGPLLLGLGLWVARAFKLEPAPLECFFLGACAAVLTLQVWNLVLPIDGRALAVYGAVSLAGWWRWGAQAAAGWRASSWRSIALVVFTLACAVWLANRSLGLTGNWDTGVYHLPSVLWAQAAPVVPGIGNVHPFMGVSHGFFELAALIGTGNLTSGPQHCVNGLLALALLALCFRGALHCVGATPLRPSSLAVAMLLPWAFMLAVGREVSSLSTDLSEVALGAFVISFWLQGFEEKLQPPALELRLLAAVLVTSALAVLKLSGAGAVAGALLAGAVLTPRLGWLVRAGGIALASVLPWSIASIIRTGAVPYPGALLRLPVDWRMPVPALEGVRLYTQAYARGTLQHWDQPQGLGWVLPRVENMLTWNREFLVPVAIAAATGLAVALLPRQPARERMLPAAALLVPAVSLAAWFVSAPDERYAGVWLQATAAFGAALAVSHLAARTAERLTLILLAVTLLRVAEVLSGGLNLVGGGFAPPPHVRGVFVTTQAGTRVFKSESVYCWDSPRPCTSHPDPWLEQRNPADVRAGFRLRPPEPLDGYRPSSLQLYPPPTRAR